MTNPTEILPTFTRYATLLSERITGATFDPRIESASAAQVERGIILPRTLLNDSAGDSVDRLIELTRSDRLGSVAVVDAGGHHRPVYRPLMIYAWLVAFRMRYETLPPDQFGRWDEALRVWANLLEAEVGEISLSDQSNIASRGDSVTESVWSSLALHVAGKVFIRDAWTDLAADTFGRLTRAQQLNGAFLTTMASDSPEPVWYHELALLHAAASYAVQSEDRTVARAAARSTSFLLENVQPDHASAQPWAVFPFIWSGTSNLPMADQLIHAATLKNPIDGVSLILLADALYCIKLFI